VRIVLDENFPWALATALQPNHEIEHLAISHRGCPDEWIIRRLRTEPCLFLTQDEDFASVKHVEPSSIIWSRVSQSLPLKTRVEIWKKAVDQFFQGEWQTHFFEVGDDGELKPQEIMETDPS